MIPMKFIKKIPASILGVGHFEPKKGGREYLLPDNVAAGLIATKDPDWEEVKPQQNNSDESTAPSGEGSRQKKGK